MKNFLLLLALLLTSFTAWAQSADNPKNFQLTGNVELGFLAVR
jgi:hypothetical protein